MPHFLKIALPILGLLLLSKSLYALPRSDAVPGGVVTISLGAASAAPQAFYNNRRVRVTSVEGVWYAEIGLGLSTKPGRGKLVVKDRSGSQPQSREIAFTIADKKYLEQHITLKDKRKVNPLERDMSRISSEQQRSRTAFNHWQETVAGSSEFILPVAGPMSSPFGKRRFFNGEARAPHSGIDIAANKGELVLSPADGVVTESGDFFFNGNTLFIDHGQGLVSMICHLDTMKVKSGDQVKRGQPLATVGMTGRATGPHLHWSVSLNGERVEPTLFLPEQIAKALETAQ
ncbi:MAG: peptidoglycan DD-metalloendopeptidase family protein [Gammaproteobacteria bacterium]|nr:peptidoglycan DD-metalloendopeptidase family protein [Gammaproteobacteria bacterium]